MAELVDQFTDVQNRVLFQLAKERPEQVARVKTASISAVELPASSFADAAYQRFPIHTPEQALLSKLYAEKQASLVPAPVMERIDKALKLYGVEPPVASQQKTASEDEQDKSQYLLPQYNALVVKTAAHVPVAAEALLQQRNKLTTQTMTSACVELIKRAARLGVDSEDVPMEIFKYAGLVTCDAGRLLDWIEARAQAAGSLRSTYEKVAKIIYAKFPHDGIIRDRTELVKIATALEQLDQEAALTPRYGRTLLDPIETVFNMDKIAMDTIALAGKQVDATKLMAIPGEIFEEILGEGVMEQSQVGGQMHKDSFRALIETLPMDLQNILYQQISAYL